MDRRVKLSCWVILAAAAAVGVQSATLTNSPAIQIGNGAAHNISVYPGKAAYDGLASGVFGDGTVLDYRFFNNETLASGGYANGGGTFVSDITYSGGLTDYAMDWADVWTATDPGALTAGIPAFDSAADFGGTNKTMSGQTVVDGSVDISRLITGSVYVLCGSYESIFSVTLVMSGAGQPSLTNSVSIDPPPSRNKYILAFHFDDSAGLYQTIAYNYTGSAGNRARFMGVIIDGETPPAGTVLIIR